jgi:hypothetical protein
VNSGYEAYGYNQLPVRGSWSSGWIRYGLEDGRGFREPEKAKMIGNAMNQDTCLVRLPLPKCGVDSSRVSQKVVEGGTSNLPVIRQENVVREILAYGRKVDVSGDRFSGQVCFVAYARQLEDLRSADRTSGYDDFLPSVNGSARRCRGYQ